MNFFETGLKGAYIIETELIVNERVFCLFLVPTGLF